MRIYEVKVLVETDESKVWRNAHEPEEICPRDLLATRRMLLNVDDMSCAYPDKDVRVTMYVATGDHNTLLAMSYDAFREMLTTSPPIILA